MITAAQARALASQLTAADEETIRQIDIQIRAQAPITNRITFNARISTAVENELRKNGFKVEHFTSPKAGDNESATFISWPKH